VWRWVNREPYGKKLEISAIQDVTLKYKQNWINHLERTDNTRLPKHALNHKLEEGEIVDAPGNDGHASMPEKVERLNPCRKMMIMIIILKWKQ